MTVFRMHQVHGLTISDETRDAIVRYLSQTNGLAPSESAAGRYALERRPNVTEAAAARRSAGDVRPLSQRCARFIAAS